jgi:hypothetical protein
MSEEIKERKYVLSDAIKSSAQIYQKTSDSKEGIRLDTPRSMKLFLQHVFTDKDGKQRKTRLKFGSSDIFMDTQIEKDKIPANDQYTEAERNALFFINGVLVTQDEYIQTFLSADNNPQREDFTGRNRGNLSPIFRELDEEKDANEENKFIFDTGRALVKIEAMSLVEVQSLVAIMFGSSYPTPARLKDCQNLCAKALEGNEERINMVLNGEWGKDEEITVLLNKAITKGVVSLENKADYVQMKKGKDWVDVKMVVADNYEQKEMLFRQFLASQEGELLRKDIEGLIAEPKQNSKK